MQFGYADIRNSDFTKSFPRSKNITKFTNKLNASYSERDKRDTFKSALFKHSKMRGIYFINTTRDKQRGGAACHPII